MFDLDILHSGWVRPQVRALFCCCILLLICSLMLIVSYVSRSLMNWELKLLMQHLLATMLVCLHMVRLDQEKHTQ